VQRDCSALKETLRLSRGDSPRRSVTTILLPSRMPGGPIFFSLGHREWPGYGNASFLSSAISLWRSGKPSSGGRPSRTPLGARATASQGRALLPESGLAVKLLLLQTLECSYRGRRVAQRIASTTCMLCIPGLSRRRSGFETSVAAGSTFQNVQHPPSRWRMPPGILGAGLVGSIRPTGRKSRPLSTEADPLTATKLP
jgi:hypothetical protein